MTVFSYMDQSQKENEEAKKLGEQRTKFTHLACMTFAQYCMWVMTLMKAMKSGRVIQFMITYNPGQNIMGQV